MVIDFHSSSHLNSSFYYNEATKKYKRYFPSPQGDFPLQQAVSSMNMTFLSHAVPDHARRVLIGNLLHSVFGKSSLSQRIEKQRQFRAVTDLKFA